MVDDLDGRLSAAEVRLNMISSLLQQGASLPRTSIDLLGARRQLADAFHNLQTQLSNLSRDLTES